MPVIVYLVQIALLLWCLFMVWRSRRALNGMLRGLILLLLLLIVRRLDDVGHLFGLNIFDEVQMLILSSAVVVLIVLEIWKLHSQREIFARYLQNRRERIAQLENLRKAASARHAWDDDVIRRM